MEVERMTSAAGPDVKPSEAYQKATYKSFKKKYRKMRIQFEERMAQNQQNYKEEQRAIETARRLAIENDQLLDLLLDVNSSAQIPPSLRFDITSSSADLTSIPELIPSEPIQCPTPEGQIIYDSIRALLDQKLAEKTNSTKPSKSLAALLTSFPPSPFASLHSDQQADLRLHHPIAYLTPDQIDESTSLTDLFLGVEVAPTIHNPTALPSKQTDKQLEVRNPHSVYNWLREHEPQVFLQDGEDLSTTNGKTGSSRGAGKRGSTVAAAPAILKAEAIPALLAEDEDMDSEGALMMSTPGTGAKGGKAKRKRVIEDDGGYRPKGGSRGGKKRKSEGPVGGSRRSSGINGGKKRVEKAEDAGHEMET